MAYDDPINKNQGAVKSSEIFLDRELEIIKNQIGESGMRTLDLIMKPISDSIRRNNFILHSTGEILWNGTEIRFDGDGVTNDIILKLMLMDEGAPRTVDLYLTGSISGNSATTFQNITLNNNELLYLELDRDLIKSAVSPSPGAEPARLIIENAAGGGSIAQGAVLKKVSLSDTNGMPEMLSTETGTTKSQTMNIPLAARLDWTDASLTSYQDLWWIPHGIRWTDGVKSVLGAVVVRGLETLPSTFVRSQAELITAVAALSTTGGTILVSGEINLDQNVTIPPGVTLCGRSDLSNTQQTAVRINVSPGGSLTLDDDSKLWNLLIYGTATFGEGINESMVVMSNNHAKVEDCTFRLTNPGVGAGSARCINISGTRNRVWHSKFRLGVSSAKRIGINYSGGSDNIDNDSYFENT